MLSNFGLNANAPSLCHVIAAIPQAKASWVSGSPLDQLLDRIDGDMVQAMQALKESSPAATPELEASIDTIFKAFAALKAYCDATDLRFPFDRSTRQVIDTQAFLIPNPARQASTTAASLDIVLPETSRIESIQIGTRQLPRLFNGLWQMASPEWGISSADQQEQALTALVEAGFTAFDMSDHYGDAELVCGDFRARLPSAAKDAVYMATKWCVFRDIGRPVTPEWVLDQVGERCRRLSGRADMLQFHWHDYSDKAYLDILAELVNIAKTRPDLVGCIGLCNFDAVHTAEACEHLLAKTGSVGLVSNQVQFSVLDSRPLKHMTSVCEKYGLKLLTYGSFCGGLLADKWLGQTTPPEPYGQTPLTPSQRKYLDTLRAWGSWEEFQALLATLDRVARQRGVAVANVAARWVLQQPAVGSVLVGTRLGVSARGDDNMATFGWELSEEDMKAINAAALGEKGEKTDGIYDKLGDCGHEYRNMHK